ncbi:MAG: hypothetical protein R3F22_05685 [Lysobacteraceae bacterium]
MQTAAKTNPSPTALLSRRLTGGCVALAMLLATGCESLTANDRSGGLPYLVANGHSVRSRHAVPLEVVLPQGFQATPVDSRRDRFNGHPFDISRAALIGADAAVMVHAETVADGSGASNYDELPQARLDGRPFRVRPPSCQDLSQDDIRGESDLEWLAAQDFPPTGPLAVAQYLASSEDHNAEIVITLMARVTDCSTEAMDAALTHLGSVIAIRAETDSRQR